MAKRKVEGWERGVGPYSSSKGVERPVQQGPRVDPGHDIFDEVSRPLKEDFAEGGRWTTPVKGFRFFDGGFNVTLGPNAKGNKK